MCFIYIYFRKESMRKRQTGVEVKSYILWPLIKMPKNLKIIDTNWYQNVAKNVIPSQYIENTQPLI